MKYIKLYDSSTNAIGQVVNTPHVSMAKDGKNVYAPAALGEKVKYIDDEKDYYTVVINEDDLPAMEFVDLGLTSGTKWASRNLGATSPCEYGDYYMWGATTPSAAADCTWDNAPFNNGSSTFDETYFSSVKSTVCNGNILKDEYDAANVSGNGKIPTKAQCDELYDECDWTPTTCESLGGVHAGDSHVKVSGWLVKSKVNSNMIFIPNSGNLYNGSARQVGDDFYLQSSNISIYYGGSEYDICSDGNSVSVYSINRCIGVAIRPVSE